MAKMLANSLVNFDSYLSSELKLEFVDSIGCSGSDSFEWTSDPILKSSNRMIPTFILSDFLSSKVDKFDFSN